MGDSGCVETVVGWMSIGETCGCVDMGVLRKALTGIVLVLKADG